MDSNGFDLTRSNRLHDIDEFLFHVGYVVSASPIADRKIILAGYRLADLLTRIFKL